MASVFVAPQALRAKLAHVVIKGYLARQATVALAGRLGRALAVRLGQQDRRGRPAYCLSVAFPRPRLQRWGTSTSSRFRLTARVVYSTEVPCVVALEP